MRQNVIIEAVPEDLVHKLTKEKTGDSMQVGLNIKIKRIGRGYTQEEIADAIGVARSTYTRYESDKRLQSLYGYSVQRKEAQFRRIRQLLGKVW